MPQTFKKNLGRGYFNLGDWSAKPYSPFKLTVCGCMSKTLAKEGLLEVPRYIFKTRKSRNSSAPHLGLRWKKGLPDATEKKGANTGTTKGKKLRSSGPGGVYKTYGPGAYKKKKTELKGSAARRKLASQKKRQKLPLPPQWSARGWSQHAAGKKKQGNRGENTLIPASALPRPAVAGRGGDDTQGACGPNDVKRKNLLPKGVGRGKTIRMVTRWPREDFGGKKKGGVPPMCSEKTSAIQAHRRGGDEKWPLDKPKKKNPGLGGG